MASPNPSFDTILSATLQNYRSQFVENILGQQVLFWKMKQRGYRGVEQGGRSVVQAIMHGENSTVKSYQGYDLLDLTPQTGFTSAELPWKQIAGSVTISGKEELENRGKAQIFNLLEGKIKQLELSLKLTFNSQLFGDGTGNGSKDITGLALAVEDGAAWSTYAGIDSNLYTFWRNQYINANGTLFGAAAGNSTWGISKMRTMFNNCSRGNSKPDLIVTTQTLFEAYEANIEGDKLRLTDTKLGEIGFANLTYKSVPIVFDEDCDANTMLFLNSEFMKLVTMAGRDFTTTPFVTPPNQDAKSAVTKWMGNLIITKRDQLGRISNLAV